ncbi:MAG: hypothetical protein KY455_00575 [Euryarchaeota archaeon]|nr:hypothetical protein [Euryarchaeota archaeon]
MRPTRYPFLLLALALLLSGCTTPGPGEPGETFGPETGDDKVIRSDEVYVPVDSVPDIHGIGVDAERPDILYVATHHGLVRAVNDTDWARVGTLRNDYMGFTAHPEEGGTFWVSGHPSEGGNMGVRHSTDGGFTWRTLALKGVDFHALTVSPADPDRLWGHFQGKIYASNDGGHHWTIVSDAPRPVLALAGDPSDADTVWAPGTQGLDKSTDGGETWSSVHDRPTATLAVDPHAPDTLFASFSEGLFRSTDGGTTWSETGLTIGEDTVGYLAFDPSTEGVLYAATYRTAIHKTTDGGENWSQVREAGR